jgi:MFS family permease
VSPWAGVLDVPRICLLFTLGNSTDAFLILRANQLGVSVALVPVLWAAPPCRQIAASIPGGALSDRLGRKPLILVGWATYAAVYFGFGRATESWQAWALFLAYGLFFGLTEGSERAMVADLVGRTGAARPSVVQSGHRHWRAPGVAAVRRRVGSFRSRAAFDVGAGLAVAAAVVLAAVRAPESVEA